AEPFVAVTDHEVGAARREVVLAGRVRHNVRRQDAPRLAAVVGGSDLELATDRVADRQAAPTARVEVHAVVERLLFVVAKGLLPRLTAVGGAVDPGRFTRTDRQYDRRTRTACLDVAEHQALGRGRADVLPAGATVGRPPHGSRALGNTLAGHPRRTPGDRVEATEALIRIER